MAIKHYNKLVTSSSKQGKSLYKVVVIILLNNFLFSKQNNRNWGQNLDHKKYKLHLIWSVCLRKGKKKNNNKEIDDQVKEKHNLMKRTAFNSNHNLNNKHYFNRFDTCFIWFYHSRIHSFNRTGRLAWAAALKKKLHLGKHTNYNNVTDDFFSVLNVIIVF